MRGVDVQVRSRVPQQLTTTTDESVDLDALGNPMETWTVGRVVQDVLVQAGATANSNESNRPDGVTVAYTCVWPKSDASSLRGCQVKVPDDPCWYNVIGDPKATPDGQMARPFRDRNRLVEVARDDG